MAARAIQSKSVKTFSSLGQLESTAFLTNDQVEANRDILRKPRLGGFSSVKLQVTRINVTEAAVFNRNFVIAPEFSRE